MTDIETRSPIHVSHLGTHVPALDGIRGIAIALVMLHHFVIYGGLQPTKLLDKVFYTIAEAGWCGVDLFFVLSGFLITGILLDTKGNAHFFRNFYSRRFIRIFPLYYGFLTVFFVLVPLFGQVSSEFKLLINEQRWYWSYLVNFLIGRQGWPSFLAIGHFWSLAVEEQFYLFWPLLVFLFRRRHLAIICVICIVASFAVRSVLSLQDEPVAAYVLTPARMDALAMGALVALLVREPHSRFISSRLTRAFAGAAALGLAAIFAWRQAFDSEDIVVLTVGLTLLALLFGAVIIIALESSPKSVLGKSLMLPVLVSLGQYSYALYIFHLPIIFLLREHVFSVDAFPRLLGSQLPGQFLFIVVGTAVALGLAVFSWHYYEQPFLKLKRLFPYVLPTYPHGVADRTTTSASH